LDSFKYPLKPLWVIKLILNRKNALLGGGIAGWSFGHKMTRGKMLFLITKER